MSDIYISQDGNATVDLQKYSEAYEKQIAALKAENAALKADAERYRWLKTKIKKAYGLLCIDVLVGRKQPTEMDAVIDAAMREWKE